MLEPTLAASSLEADSRRAPWLAHKHGACSSASIFSYRFLEVNFHGSSLLSKSSCILLSCCCLLACPQGRGDVLTARRLVFYFCHSIFSLALLDQDGCLFSFPEPAMMQKQRWQKGHIFIYWYLLAKFSPTPRAEQLNLCYLRISSTMVRIAFSISVKATERALGETLQCKSLTQIPLLG